MQLHDLPEAAKAVAAKGVGGGSRQGSKPSSWLRRVQQAVYLWGWWQPCQGGLDLGSG
jgi:hypothetical protein